MYFQRVENDSVWQSLKILFTGALIIFLINIFFGFDNALTVGEIDRWQILIHLHGGSVGWITLSAIGIAIWLFTGRRQVDAGYESRVRTLVWAAVLIFLGYVPSFGLAFSRPSGFLVALLPIFGLGAVTILWISAIFALSQLRRQPVLTTVHILSAGALLTAAIGATVGMLLGLERAIGEFLPLPAGDRVGAHAGMMDTYLFLVASCIVEWAIRKEEVRWTPAGLAQALLWMVGASLVPIAYFLNVVDQVLPVFMLMLLLGMIIFLGRYGWRALTNFSVKGGVKSWSSIGAIWLVVYMGLFLYLISVFMSGSDMEGLGWLFTAFAHAGFVGMMTNLLMGVVASRAQEAANVWPWAEAASLWAINLGLLLFIVLKYTMDIRFGAIIMGIGVLLGVITMLRRLQAAPASMAPA